MSRTDLHSSCMTRMNFLKKALAFGLPLLVIYSCASYNQQSSEFYNSLQQGNYGKASKNLDQNRLLKKSRNHLLYLLEKGKVEHLLQHYEASNRYLNEADLIMEDQRVNAGDLIASNLMNPMMQRYQSEDFEKYMVHYYKAINYLQLDNTEDALVEARRISLRADAQNDRTQNNDNYSEDAFSFILQGLIYEKAADANNAFISYRNAADLYLSHGLSFYGTNMPLQLKKDLLRMAYLNNFQDELERYEGLLGIKFDTADLADGRGLVVFWENGLAPVKKEQDLYFSLSKDGSDFYFVDQESRYRIPYAPPHDSKMDWSAHSFRVAMPRYERQPLVYESASVHVNGVNQQLETAQDISELALATLRERWLKELSRMIIRQATKKIAEEAARPKEADKSKDNKDKKDNKPDYGRAAFAVGLKIFNTVSEKADTRNWQSLPHAISYARLPLAAGSNSLHVLFQGPANTRDLILNVEDKPGLQFRVISTIR